MLKFIYRYTIGKGKGYAYFFLVLPVREEVGSSSPSVLKVRHMSVDIIPTD